MSKERGGDERRGTDKRGEKRREKLCRCHIRKMFGTDNTHKETSVCAVCDVFRKICATSSSERSPISNTYRIKVIKYALDQTLAVRLVSKNMSTSRIKTVECILFFFVWSSLQIGQLGYASDQNFEIFFGSESLSLLMKTLEYVSDPNFGLCLGSSFWVMFGI